MAQVTILGGEEPLEQATLAALSLQLTEAGGPVFLLLPGPSPLCPEPDSRLSLPLKEKRRRWLEVVWPDCVVWCEGVRGVWRG